jgi:TonB-linked SusC/RagA family outer membrane protein
MKKKFKIFKIFVLLLTIGFQAYGQSQKIEGKVTDDVGQPLPGATVIIVGTSQGAVTDFDGAFTLKASPGDKLNFSFIGFKSQTITVGKQLVVNVQMVADTEGLDEVVVVGYSTQKKATVVGSITQATSEDLKRQGNINNITDALSGAIPGVTILPTTGLPGGGGDIDGANYTETEILIRGKSTWNNSSPLILVDGIERTMNDIEINEIETISVLKDASATAVFGMKGGNGVILITSKRGLIGKPKLTFEVNQSFENISKYPVNANTYNALVARNRAIINEVDVKPTSWAFYQPDAVLQHYLDQDLPFAFPDNNWRDIMLKDFASSQRINMNVAGGTQFVKYFGSLSYNHQGDIFVTQNLGQGYDPEFSYDRFNFRTNFDFTISKSTQFSLNLSGLYGKQQRSGAGTSSLFSVVSGHSPDVPVIQYEDGVYGFSGQYDLIGQNEFVNINYSGTNVDNRTELNSDFTLNQKLDFLTKGLSFKARLAFDNIFTTNGPEVSDSGVLTKLIRPEFYLNGGSYNYDTQQYEINGVPVDMIGEGYAIYNYPTGGSDGFEWVPQPLGFSSESVNGANANRAKNTLYYEASLSYARSFGKHAVSALALVSRQKTETGSSWPQKREDYVGRVTYDYNSLYFGEVNGAYNGSEKFGPGYKFDFFPSVAVGWNIANEALVKKHASFINNLKVRYSIGVVGNDRVNGQQWGYITTWNQGGPFADDDDNGRFGLNRANSYLKYNEGSPGNPFLRWEKSTKQNIGVEFGFLKGLISGSVDVFNEDRNDILVAGNDRVIPHIFGQTPPAANIGQVKSNGYEIEVFLSKKLKNGINYRIGGSWTRAVNKTIYREDAELKPFYQKLAGYPIGQIRLTQQTGFIQSWDDLYNGANSINNNIDLLPGDFRFMDYNANGAIDPDDAAPYGYPVYPLNTYTGNLSVGYKGWDLNVLLYGTTSTTREVSYSNFQYNSASIQQFYIDATFTPEYGNQNPTYPSIALQKGNSGAGTFNYYDGSILRLRSIEIAYTLPKKWSKVIGTSKTRLYANGNNLFVWTDMPADGEGSDKLGKNYPLKKVITIGANIQF